MHVVRQSAFDSTHMQASEGGAPSVPTFLSVVYGGSLPPVQTMVTDA